MNTQDVVLIHTRFALQHPLQLSVDSRVVLLQQNTLREFTSAFFTDGGSQLVKQVCIVHSSYCTSLG